MNLYTDFKAFNGDFLLAKQFIKLRDKFGIYTVIETGTYQADTTEWLAQNFNRVKTIEVKEEYFYPSQAKLSFYPTVDTYLANSAEYLKGVIEESEKPLMVFLDAHWYDYNPLLGELEAIKESGEKPVLVIHDFKVPGKDFGYDVYPKITYEWSAIENHIKDIYGNDYEVHYNEKAEGMKRGCVFIYPKI